MWVRACLSQPQNQSSYCTHAKDLQNLKNRLVIAKQHAVAINNNENSTMHARVISVQIVRHIELEIERKEKILDDILDGYTFDRMYRDYM